MHRRLLLTALACWPAPRLLAQDDGGRPRHKISAGELHRALSARFPVRFGVREVLEVQVSAPQLLLSAARNQLGATLQAQVGGLQLPRNQGGELDAVFSVRYEPSDRSIRAHELDVLAVRWPGLAPNAVQTLQRVLPAMAREAVGEVVLHQFTPRELALPETMGFVPQRTEVVDDGLVVWFGPKPP